MSSVKSMLCAIALLVSTSIHAQTVPAQLNLALNRTLDSMRTVIGSKSLSAAIQLPDGAVWEHATGISSVNPTVSVTTQDVFLIGSVTKTLTAACVLQLAQQGLLRLDDSLHEWLDTINYINPNITIRQLLQHTSGIYDVLSHPHNPDSMMADITRIWTPEELIEDFISPPNFQPGAAWAYSNTNYFLLGMIIKKVTGNPFYTEIRNRFFTPRGLNTFAIPAFETITSPIAHVWIDIDGDNILDDAHGFYMSYMALNSAAGAAGGYFATPADCTRWMRAYMRGDVLSASMMAEAKTMVSAPGSQGGLYGLGMMKNSFLGYEAYGHGGDLAYHASSWYFPQKDISITVLNNDNTKDSWKLLNVVRELLRTYLGNASTGIGIAHPQTTGFHVYPNPFIDAVTITRPAQSNEAAFDLSIQDALGRIIMTRTEHQTAGQATRISIDGMGALPAGLYFMSIQSASGIVQTIRLVK